MKFLVVLSLLAIASASTLHSLSEITGATSTVTVTALYPDAGTAPTLTSIAYPVTYDSSVASLAAFSITSGGASYVGNNTVTYGILSLTNGGDTINVAFAATPVLGTNTVTFSSVNYYLKFLNTANYAATVTLYTATFGVYVVTLSTAFPVVAATKYTPPTVTAYKLVTPQSGGCDSTSCTGYLNGTIAATTRPLSSWTNYLRSSHASNGVVLSSSASFTSGASDFNVDSVAGLVVNIGGVVSNVWTPVRSGATISTVAPKNDNLAISGQFYETTSRSTYFNEAAMAAFQASVTINQGGTDVTAPTCTVLTVSPTTVNTVAAAVSVTVTLTCADENGGSGLWTSGLFATASVTSGSTRTSSFAQFVTAGSYSESVPPYVSGTFTVVGVFAVDNAGNAALYGSCGGVAGYDSLGCAGGGSGSSSASTVVFSLFSVLLAVLVLFA